MTDVSRTIYSGDWELYPRKDGTICLQDFMAEVPHMRIVLTDAEALQVWQVLNVWVERNAPNVEEEE